MDAGHNFTVACIKHSKFLNFLIAINFLNSSLHNSYKLYNKQKNLYDRW